MHKWEMREQSQGVSHLLHMAFFTGLYDSRGQPYVTPLGCKVEPVFSLQSALMGRKAGLVLGRDGRSLVSNRTVPLSSPSRIPWQVYGGEGGSLNLSLFVGAQKRAK